MSSQYIEKTLARFSVETINGRTQFVLKPQGSLYPKLFLMVWLAGWSFGGYSAFEAFSKNFEPFLLIWLCGWALGEIFVTITLAWLWTGAEIIRATGSDLEVSYRVLGFTRRKLYRGSDIRELRSSSGTTYQYPNQLQLPILVASKSGCLQFSYGAQTIYAGAGYDETEGRLIVEALRKYLPVSATARS